MPDAPQWGPPYPDPDEVRADVEAMVGAVTGTLVDRFGAAIAGLWFKGSAQKQWDTPIDYVPEVGDVDIHVRAADADALASVHEADTMLDVHAAIEMAFRRERPHPRHIPRVQFVAADEVERIPGYLPVPTAAARTLYGETHTGPGDVDQSAVRRTDTARLLELSDPVAVAHETTDLIELPGHHLFWALRRINWRVSPVGPLVLSAAGADYETAWSSNRTGVVTLLRAAGHTSLADDYVGYYVNAWRFWLSRWQDGDAGRAAFGHAVRTINAGRDFAART